ncbi:MAG: YdcF family protein [Xenococcaceae cyanobacterium]
MSKTPCSCRRVKKLWGLIEYKSLWTLTIRGWILILLWMIALMIAILTQIQPFLAFSAPIKADALVVEGWVEDDAIKGAIAEFERGDYKILITTGTPLSRGYYLAEYKNFAELTAATFIALGFDPDKLIAVPAPKVKRNRTVTSAVALREWLSTADVQIQSINVYSSDVHTRRSWLLFKRVLAGEIEVGAIAYPPLNYDPKYWWTSSEGVRLVISETIAYLYARLINWRN